jgi:hypothetical protein
MSVLQRNKDVVSRKIAGELFLVPISGNLADMEHIFTLTTVGEFIWDRMDGKKSINDICDEIMTEFDVERNRADSDIREFVAVLISAGLIQETTS